MSAEQPTEAELAAEAERVAELHRQAAADYASNADARERPRLCIPTADTEPYTPEETA